MDHLNLAVGTNHANIPEEFRGGHWAVSTLAPKDDGKPDKAPRHPVSGQMINVAMPNGGTDEQGKVYAAWATFAECAQAVVERRFTAMGRLMRREDGFTVIDFDDPGKASDPAAARDVQTALKEQLVGTYCETSTSGKGSHYILRGCFATGGTRDSRSQIEAYCDERYIITTGSGGGTIQTAGAGRLEGLLASMRSSSNPPADLGGLKGGGLSFDEARKLGGSGLAGYLAGYPENADRSDHDFKPLGILATYEIDPDVAVEVFMASALASPERIAQKRSGSEIKFREYIRSSYIKLLGKEQAKRARRERLHAAMIYPGVAGARDVFNQMLDAAKNQDERLAIGADWVAALVASGKLLVSGKSVKDWIAVQEIAEDDRVVIESAVIDDDAAAWAVPCDPRTAPGLIGFGTRDHHDKRVIRDTPIPGYLAHLLATSTIMGLAFRSTFPDKPDFANIQILAALPSLLGKEDIDSEASWAIDIARHMGMRVNFATGYASAPAAHTAFSEDPYQCYVEDEAGRKAQAQRKAGGDPHQMGLATFFMEMYNRYRIASRPYSDRASKKPAVPHAFGTMLRMSQPETLAPTLEKMNLRDGLLTRPYFIHEPVLPAKRPFGERHYTTPHQLLMMAYRIVAGWALPFNLAAVKLAKYEIEVAEAARKKEDGRVIIAVPDPMPDPIPVVPTPEAKAIYKKFDDFCEAQVLAGYTIWGRASQNAKRLAMVLAVGVEALKLAESYQQAGQVIGIAPPPAFVPITDDVMVWACAEIAGRLRSLGKFATEEIHGDNTESKIAAEVEKYLGKHGGRALVTKLAGGLAKNGQKDFEYERIKRVILGMVESGRLVGDVPVTTGSPMPRGLRVSLPSSRKR